MMLRESRAVPHGLVRGNIRGGTTLLLRICAAPDLLYTTARHTHCPEPKKVRHCRDELTDIDNPG